MNNPVLEALALARVDELIDPPRSWGKQEKLMFLQLPRPLQLYYAERESDRERELRRAQNEAASARKSAADAESKLKACEARLAEIEEKNVEVKDVAA